MIITTVASKQDCVKKNRQKDILQKGVDGSEVGQYEIYHNEKG